MCVWRTWSDNAGQTRVDEENEPSVYSCSLSIICLCSFAYYILPSKPCPLCAYIFTLIAVKNGQQKRIVKKEQNIRQPHVPSSWPPGQKNKFLPNGRELVLPLFIEWLNRFQVNSKHSIHNMKQRMGIDEAEISNYKRDVQKKKQQI